MPKQILRGEEIYLAPQILGRYEHDTPVAIDERNDNRILDPNNIDDKITIYEREVTDWFLNPAFKLLDDDSYSNSFIVLMVCMSYIEGVEQYKTGVESSRRSKQCFAESINRIYPERFRGRDINKLYTKSRCGLFHNGMVKGGVIFNNSYSEVFEFNNGGETIRINPTILLSDIINDFNTYINELRSHGTTDDGRQITESRNIFNRMFSVLPQQ